MKKNRKNQKKALFIVPHQDDEINIGCGIIPLLIENKIDVKVVFATNGDYSTRGSRRIRECYQSLTKLGVTKENVILMGYSDQHKRENTHIYNTKDDTVWLSKKGFSETYHPLNGEEWCYKKGKEHHKYNKDNFINDLISIIDDLKPNAIYTIDFDSHPDHRVLSLSVEKAIGKVLLMNNGYHPYVYKSFAYPTCYFGVKDFNAINIKSTKFNTEKFSYCNMQNPYYSWDERVRFPVLYSSITKNVFSNKTIKAMKCHKSQLLINEAFSSINGDQIFWQRRTDNLLIDANIKTSSGDKEKLYDFMLFDCTDLMKGNKKKPKLEHNSWIPDKEDKNPNIEIRFDDLKKINEIKFYHSIETDGKITRIEITFGNGIKKIYELIPQENNVSILKINDIETDRIKIRVIRKDGQYAGFSEIEILENKKCDSKFIKFVIDDDFAYKYYYKNEKFNVYYYDGEKSRYLKSNEYQVEGNTIELNNNKLLLKKRKNKVYIRCLFDESLSDEVTMYKINNFDIAKNKVINIISKVYIKTCYTLQRIIRKINIYIGIN